MPSRIFCCVLAPKPFRLATGVHARVVTRTYGNRSGLRYHVEEFMFDLMPLGAEAPGTARRVERKKEAGMKMKMARNSGLMMRGSMRMRMGVVQPSGVCTTRMSLSQRLQHLRRALPILKNAYQLFMHQKKPKRPQLLRLHTMSPAPPLMYRCRLLKVLFLKKSFRADSPSDQQRCPLYTDHSF
jgi:hypothetical protein